MPRQVASKTKVPAKSAASPVRRQRPPAPVSTPALAGVAATLQGSGEGLEPKVRATMQERFGYDFGGVRVHADAHAARSARALNARAYALGRHLVFDSGEYRPADPAGLRLLAHELAHVVQQGAAPYRPDRGIDVSPASSSHEREADRAAQRVLAGRQAGVRPAADAGQVQRLQRAEHGTYVSKLGGNPYLEAGEKFYSTWGHPNVRRVSNMKEVLDDLDRAKGTIDTFRIVSHGSSVGLELGLLPEIAKDYFFAPATHSDPTGRFTTEAGFRAEFVEVRVVAESKFTQIYAALWKDGSTQALLTTLGGAKDPPKQDSDLGILLRAMVDERFLADVKLGSGKPPTIPNVGAIKTFNSSRRRAYGARVVEAKPKDEQAAARIAIGELAKLLPTVMAGAKISFGALTQSEADTLADPFLETPGRGTLKKSLAKSIEEGAGGSFLRRLKSVRSKINSKTHVEIRGCNVGSKPETIDGLRGFFGNPGALPSLSAPDLYQFYFQLNVKTYHKDEQADLEAAYDDPAVGVKAGFEDLTRMKAGEMIRLHVGGKLAELAKLYGFDAAKVRGLNPEIEKPDELKPGDLLWLVQREVVPAGIFKTLEEFCEKYLGNRHAWPKVWAANPWLGKPRPFKPDEKITVPRDVLQKPFASAHPDKAAFVAAVRGGQAVSGLARELDVKVRTRRGGVTTERRTFARPRPVLHVDDAKRNEALGKWLAAQKFDPKGRTAKVLSRRFARFETGRTGTYVQFLTRGYPNAEDPIFPEDPRYDKHIIRRP